MKPVRAWTPYLLLAPAFAVFAFVVLIPALANTGLSFANWSGTDTLSWVGLDNFARAFRDEIYLKAYGNTFIGSVAVGAVGAGASADINVFQRNTTASVGSSLNGAASQIDARGGATVKARSTQGVSSIVIGASGGVVGVVGSGSVAKFVSRTEALKFALFENGNRPQAIIMMPGPLELDMTAPAKAHANAIARAA